MQLPWSSFWIQFDYYSSDSCCSSNVHLEYTVNTRVFSALFHMDIFPRIPRSFLMELVKYSRMECNATPLDLSPIAEQLDDYVPCVSRIGTRHDFSQVILKVLFLAAILSSIPFSLSVM